MFKPGLAFVRTSSQTNLRTLVRVLIYRHVVDVSSCSLVLVSRYERVATIGNFYTEDAYTKISGEFNLIKNRNAWEHGAPGWPHSPWQNIFFILFLLKNYCEVHCYYFLCPDARHPPLAPQCSWRPSSDRRSLRGLDVRARVYGGVGRRGVVWRRARDAHPGWM
jgi:hypothetical protein